MCAVACATQNLWLTAAARGAAGALGAVVPVVRQTRR